MALKLVQVRGCSLGVVPLRTSIQVSAFRSLHRRNPFASRPNVVRYHSCQTPSKGRGRSRYSMPAEWQPHTRTITVWPNFASIGDLDALKSARKEVSAISNAIADFEPVTMYTQPENVSEAKATVSEYVHVVGLEVGELWVRDSGPIIVTDVEAGDRKGLDVNFNYWGGKRPSMGDAFAAERILSHMELPMVKAPFQAEGGGIEVDGQGTLLATDSSILNDNRNPGITRQQIEEHLGEFLGVKKPIWLPGVKGWDITDYHVDAFARFIKPGVVLLGRPPDAAEAKLVEAYRGARETLLQETDARGRRLEVIEVSEPELLNSADEGYGTPVASYMNFLRVNGGVIMPRFGLKRRDEGAFELFKDIFAGAKVVQVNLETLPKMGGGIHCATQHIPAFLGNL